MPPLKKVHLDYSQGGCAFGIKGHSVPLKIFPGVALDRKCKKCEQMVERDRKERREGDLVCLMNNRDLIKKWS